MKTQNISVRKYSDDIYLIDMPLTVNMLSREQLERLQFLINTTLQEEYEEDVKS